MKQSLQQDFSIASGPVPYCMINDYLFRAVLQSNNKALKGLICALLHLSEQEVFSVEITNPIVLGESVENKEFRLDINVILNNNTLINLEMQIANKLNWRERSVMYLCRSFDQLNHGQDYTETKPVIHIGFLDYSLFEECPEFYASYKLINIKNYQKYSDSLTLYVVDLSHIDLATEEDKRYHIHEWARLFKATTWEEIRMIASKDEYLKEASQTMFRMSADDLVRKRCRDREEYYQDMRNYERAIAEREEKIERDRIEHEQDMRNYERAIAEREEKIERDRIEHEQDLRNYERVIAEQEEKIERDRIEHEQDMRNYEHAIAEREEKIERDRIEHEQDLRNYEHAIAEREEKIERDRIEHEQDMRNYERAIAEREEKIERDRIEHEQDLRNYERAIAEREEKIERDRIEHEQDMRNYERAIAEREEKIERDRIEHEQDMRNYERAIAEQEEKIERDRIEHEQDMRNYERAIAEKEQEYKRTVTENEKLRAEIERLKNS